MFGTTSRKTGIFTETIPLTGNFSNATLTITPEQASEYPDDITSRRGDQDSHASRLESSWRFTVRSGALAGSVIFLINLVTLVVVYARFGVQESASTIYEGSCSTTSRVTIASHLLINILSTVLLGWSNYAMQCVSAPTRSELDRAHRRHRWLSIGTPNIRNLFFVSWTKTVLWMVLCISSFPLHLIWNSTVFQTQQSNEYIAFSVTPNFLEGGSWLNSTNNNTLNTNIVLYLQEIQDETSQNSSNSSWQYLDVDSCIRAYNTDMLIKYRNVVLVVDPVNVTTSSDGSLLAVYSSDQGDGTSYLNTWPFAWMCDDPLSDFGNGAGWTCMKNLLQKRQWVPGQNAAATVLYGNQDGNPVSHCYAETVSSQHCKVKIIPIFLMVVMVCNVLKIACFVLCLRITRKSPPLVTTGDAVASFLERPDDYTKGRCLVSKYDYDKGWFFRSKEWLPRSISIADTWYGGSYRWGKAIRARQWTFYMLMICTSIMVAGAFFGPDGIGGGTTESWPAILQLGLGQPHANYNLEYGVSSIPILSGFLTANSPQLIVSYLYLGLSNFLTTMTAMAEWTRYGQNARGLRVSTPKKDSAQRSNYLLSLPYRYGVPMAICVTLLHYFVSEMVFLAQIDVYDFQGNLDAAASTTQTFFSPLAMLISVSLGSAIVVALVLLGIFKKYPGNIPLAGCCSASIAAACQPCPGQERLKEGLALEKVKWGVCEYDERGVGHATFAAEDIMQDELQKGCQYA